MNPRTLYAYFLFGPIALFLVSPIRPAAAAPSNGSNDARKLRRPLPPQRKVPTVRRTPEKAKPPEP